eukprot:SAG11_NODE_2990_length_2786_cov_4.823570_3_plen_73_part_00
MWKCSWCDEIHVVEPMRSIDDLALHAKSSLKMLGGFGAFKVSSDGRENAVVVLENDNLVQVDVRVIHLTQIP